MPGTPVHQDGEDILLRIKAVPGARRDEVAGRLGDRIKLRTAAPPEGGRANRAICLLIARALDVKKCRVTIESGLTSPEKTVRITGVTRDDALERLGM